MLKDAIPVLGVSDSRAASDFYCGKLGFGKQFEYRPRPDRDAPCRMGLSRGDATIRVSSFSGDSVPCVGVIMWTSDVDGLRAEFTAKGVHIDMEPTDQSWGTREMHVRDADGNLLVFTQVNPPPPASSLAAISRESPQRITTHQESAV